MYCISVSHKSADVEIRKKLAFTEGKITQISDRLIECGVVLECVILCTCNRAELYYCGNESAKADIIHILSQAADIEEELLSKHILYFSGDNAVYHLFKVASGIESIVIGEDEILGQTKQAYMIAKENNSVSYELNMIFQAAIACAKKVKTDTRLSKTSVSVATLAAAEAARCGESVNVLVIGASGKIGTSVLKNLASYKNVSVKAALRKYSARADMYNDLNIEAVDYAERYQHILNADCVISATGSPHYTVTLYDLKHTVADGRNRLFIDLAVPPDIDPAIGGLSWARLINIDYFKELARVNNEIKLSSVDEAEQIIHSEIDQLKKDMLFHDFLPLMDSVKEKIADKPFEELVYKMKAETDSRSFEQFIDVLKLMAEER